MAQIKGTPKQGLFGATLGFFAGFAAVSLFGPTANSFKDAMGLTPLLVGLLVAVPSLSGSLLRIPFGAWVDNSGGRKPFLILLWMSVAGMIGLTLVVRFLYPGQLSISLYPLLLFLGVLCGCGIATFSVGISQVSYWFPQARQGSALGAYAGIGNLAPGLFSLLIPLVLGRWGLDVAYLAWLVFLVLGVVLYHLTGLNSPYFQLRLKGASPEEARTKAQESGQEIFPKGNPLQSLVLAAHNWRTWLLVAIYFASFGGFLAMTSWLPTYWKSFFQIGAVLAGFLTALYSLTASLIRVSGGSISDRFGGEQTAVGALAAMVIGAVVMTFSHALVLSVVGVVVMALGMGTTNAAVFKLMPQYVKEAVGGASGWIGGLGAFGGFLIPPILGAIVNAMGANGYAVGFATFLLMALISLVLAIVLRQAKEKVKSSQAEVTKEAATIQSK